MKSEIKFQVSKHTVLKRETGTHSGRTWEEAAGLKVAMWRLLVGGSRGWQPPAGRVDEGRLGGLVGVNGGHPADRLSDHSD